MQSSLIWRFFVQGCIETALMIWFIFGYGYILILSCFATILPKKFHTELWHKQALDGYKPHQKKWLWAGVGFYFALKMSLVISLALTIKQ